MARYNEIKKKLNDGDKLLTQVNTHPGERVVEVRGDGVICNDEWFWWDFFFEVNHPVGEEIEK